jgi:hypothetical protein
MAAFPSRRIQLRMDPNVRHLSSGRLRFALALLLGMLAAPCLGVTNQKLYMKDGTFQIVSAYELQGDRVRYFSVERGEWEEVPTNLVDFDATQRAVEDTKAAHQKQIEEAKEIERERFQKPPDQGMEVVPGMRLPGDDGLFTIEGKRLVRLPISSGEVVTDKKRAAMVLAVPLPVVKTRSLVLLAGPKATIRLNDPWPEFYVQSAAALGTRLELVRLKPGKESRVLENVNTARGKNGKSTEERTMVSLQRKQIAANIYALKPLQPLEAGEYALGEVVDDKLSLDVYDFGYEKWETVR